MCVCVCLCFCFFVVFFDTRRGASTWSRHGRYYSTHYNSRWQENELRGFRHTTAPLRGFSFICTTGAPLPYASFAAVAFDGGCLLLTVWASSYLSRFSPSSRLVSGLGRSEPLFQLSSDSVRRGPPLPSVSQSQAGLLAEFLCPRRGVPSLSSTAAAPQRPPHCLPGLPVRQQRCGWRWCCPLVRAVLGCPRQSTSAA